MPAFQKLIVGAAERIAKRQAELDELQRAAAKRIELESAANSMFRNPDVAPQGPLELLHGSPHKFDEFDFENNLMKGEGALAYGPGGYMTGYEPLAREYAKNLFARHALSGSSRNNYGRMHLPLKEAAKEDPRATAQYLRAVNVGKALRGSGGKTRGVRADFVGYNSIPPHLVPTVDFEPYKIGKWYDEGYVVQRQSELKNLEEYLNAYRQLGINGVTELPTRIGQGGLPKSEMLRLGREMQKALKNAPEPKLTERLRIVPKEEFEPFLANNDGYHALNAYSQGLRAATGIGPGGPDSIPGFTHIRKNLNSTNRVIAGRPGRATYQPSMDGAFDLRNPRLPGESDEQYARRIYRAQFDANFADMLPYDYPIATMAPEKLGGLAQLAEQHGFLEKLDPNMSGSSVLDLMQRHVPGSNADRMRALRDAGIPATFYLRGGRRGALPDRLDPNDFNFVIHDQSRLARPDVEEFRTGGSV